MPVEGAHGSSLYLRIEVSSPGRVYVTEQAEMTQYFECSRMCIAARPVLSGVKRCPASAPGAPRRTPVAQTRLPVSIVFGQTRKKTLRPQAPNG